jgi:hypothetical protein
MPTLMDVRSPTLPSTPPPASRSSPGTAAPAGPRWRPWIFAVIGMVELTAAVVLFVMLRPDREPPPSSPPTGVPLVRPPAPAAPGAGQPASARVELLSVPTGATVSIGGKPLGVTPLGWSPTPPAQVTAFTFDLDGHRREVIYAFPSPGLKLTANLRRLAGKRPPATHSDGSAIPDDIKSER